ncbi:GGDEF domain-containing protein [Bradyrhizobium canariense]|uniref:GGDEF domain-containing protein n=1 Tax=Bradyrhizobium canariense TaxID=255045 RepID=UPI000A18F534|nr:GGDEF domain-containing protein [Bradyrhizobium canariense]OSI28014.1 GGDEF domain-containing protein [Bradyrhizobium canariense]OSI32134.1 GGDEF domain-containing protein [Bradyrhizobium canariense]OSI41921.1 GGDEF domain-containing protein [Bradyrhizobium canariense]OSI47390.1 GGDEF domain-containing protein [Bradyrhizobium canariense]OSI58248.1 GGDEF domain-containing protein [Bradyrhizobium canariense]
MLNVPTLWTVFVVNFLALGLIWAYVMRTYPKFAAARFWMASSFIGATGAMTALLRLFVASPLPLLLGAAGVIAASCLAAMGIQRFYHRPVSWRVMIATAGLSLAGVVFFVVGFDNMQLRMLCYTFGQAVPLVLALRLLLSPPEGRVSPGARLSGIVILAIIAILVVRTVGNLLGGDFSANAGGQAHGVMVLGLLFLSMTLNFGFLLMAMDSLRNEVADLALLDDLTGVANRRHLLQRLSEECARSERSSEPFSLLVIDLDGFKTINDTHGHAAGDACLQHFTLMAQTRLRPGDMLARTGGDEFCVVLPSSTLREAAAIARRVLEVCRQDAVTCTGVDIPIAISIGVAQWDRGVGQFPDRLIAHADHALYAAKKNGKNDFAVHDPAPPLMPDPIGPGEALRKFA